MTECLYRRLNAVKPSKNSTLPGIPNKKFLNGSPTGLSPSQAHIKTVNTGQVGGRRKTQRGMRGGRFIPAIEPKRFTRQVSKFHKLPYQPNKIYL